MYAQLLSTLVGIWLMAAPAVLGYGGAAATNDHVIGPVVATFALIAAWEATRSLRLVNLPLAAWLLLAPWVLAYGNPAAVNSSLAALAVFCLSLVRGKITHRYAGGWSALWRRSL